MIRTAIADAIAGIVILCGAGGLLLYTGSTDYTAGDSIAFNAAWFPTLLLSIAAITASIMIIKAGLSLAWPAAPKLDNDAEPTLPEIVTSRLILSIGLTLVYLLAFVWLGFWISTVGFMVVFSWIFGFRNALIVAGVTALFASVTWLVFTKLLYIQIPAWLTF